MDDSTATYVLRVQGALDEYWAAGFAGLSMSVSSDGTTVLAGPLADQAALHGVLRRIRDLGLVILSLERQAPVEPPGPTSGSEAAPATGLSAD